MSLSVPPHSNTTGPGTPTGPYFSGLLGLIVHLVHPGDGDTVRAIDLWESEEAHDAFDKANNPPAVLAQVLTRRGLRCPQLIGRDVFEAQALVRGRPT